MTTLTRLIELANEGSRIDQGFDRTIERLRRFWSLTESLAELSTCRRASVGCTLVMPDMSGVASIGYNGQPKGSSNFGCRSEKVGACGCIHAEPNALVKLAWDCRGLVMLTTYSPCEHCAGLISNSARVSHVLYGVKYRDPAGLLVLERAGIVTTWIGSILKEVVDAEGE